MKTFALAAALLVAGSTAVPLPIHAHGGTYRGPGDTVPPGGSGRGGGAGVGPTTGPAGPTNAGTGASTTPYGGGAGPRGSGGLGGITGDSGPAGADLTQWSFWWEFNKEPYLNLKSKLFTGVPATGTEGWFLGPGERSQSKNSLQPSEEQVRREVVPALLAALEKESHNDIVTGCLIALAKIGDPPSEDGSSRFAPLLTRFLADKNQEISETAAVSLGILASADSIDTLEALLRDRPEGRRWVGSSEVPYRTRAFAAYGLGLIGAQTGDEASRRTIVRCLREALESDDTKTRDLKVACLLSLGLVPLSTTEVAPARVPAGDPGQESPVPPESSRMAQLEYLLAFLGNQDENYLVRAHCPTALARLLTAGDLPPRVFAEYRRRIAEELLARMDRKSREQVEVVQSSILALGLIGTNDGKDALDRRIRSALIEVPKNVSDQQARYYALIALAKIGGSVGAEDPDTGIDEVKKALLTQLSDGMSGVRPWAGLASGVMVNELNERKFQSAAIGSLQAAVRSSLAEERDGSKVGAYAISAGIMGDVEAAKILVTQLDEQKTDEARGYVAIGLGLMGASESIEKIHRIVDDSKYRPELLKAAAIALGLLGDKQVVPQLTELLASSKGLAAQASLSSALGIIGDRDSIAPLVKMLADDSLTAAARGFAAAALGIVADKEPLPWNSRISLDLNYRAATSTLTDRTTGTGILDLL